MGKGFKVITVEREIKETCVACDVSRSTKDRITKIASHHFITISDVVGQMIEFALNNYEESK